MMTKWLVPIKWGETRWALPFVRGNGKRNWFSGWHSLVPGPLVVGRSRGVKLTGSRGRTPASVVVVVWLKVQTDSIKTNAHIGRWARSPFFDYCREKNTELRYVISEPGGAGTRTELE